MILLTGLGILGRCIKEEFESDKNENNTNSRTEFISLSRTQESADTHINADITDKASMESVFSRYKPSVVIHTAAFANVDGCENDPVKAQKINAEGTEIISRLSKKYSSKLVYISTAFVFDGLKAGRYSESDTINPVSVYAASKLAGEKIAIETEAGLDGTAGSAGYDEAAEVAGVVRVPKSLVFRVDYTYGPYGSNFAKWIIAELSKGNTIKVINDETFTPTYAVHCASSLRVALEKNLHGIYHIGSADALSKHDFAVKLAKALGFDAGLIQPISGAVFWENKARRPKNSAMDCSKAIKAGLVVKSTDECLSDLRKRMGYEK